MKRVDLIVGTRPDAIKMAPVVHALRAKRELQVRVVSTGQHRELVRQALGAFGVEPDVDLDVMRPGQTLSALTSAILGGLEKAFSEHRPDYALVHGDTATCFSAMLSSFYQRIPIAHVEAGLRTFDLGSPFPEEFYRQTVAKLASLHFAPTERAKANLVKEGVTPRTIEVCGNTGSDALKMMLGRLPRQRRAGYLVLMTLHRRENHHSFEQILGGIRDVARSKPAVDFVYPLHPNPALREGAQRTLSGLSNVRLTEALPYPEFVGYLRQASVVLTDSGGTQEEAGYLGKRVVLLRDKTERPAEASDGLLELAGTEPTAFVPALLRSLEHPRQSALNLPAFSPSAFIADKMGEVLQ